MNPACPVDRLRVSASVSLSTTALATVISSPSRIQATPRAITMRVWKGDQGSRSIRAGMRLRITPGAGASRVVVIERLRARGSWVVAGSVLSLSGTRSTARAFSVFGGRHATLGEHADRGVPDADGPPGQDGVQQPVHRRDLAQAGQPEPPGDGDRPRPRGGQAVGDRLGHPGRVDAAGEPP